MSFRICRKIQIVPTPYELARSFAEFNADQQAQFFSDLSEVVSKWEKHFSFQLQHVTDSEKLTAGGRETMIVIGDYGPASKD